MRTFTIRYTDRGQTATVTVQGNEIATMDDRLCIRQDGMSILTFPKDEVLHVTSHDDGADWPAPVDDEIEAAPWRPAVHRPAWTPVNQGAPLRRPLQQAAGVRLNHRETTRATIGQATGFQQTTGVRVNRRVVSGPRPLVSP